MSRSMYVALGVLWLLAAVAAVGQLVMLRDEGREAPWWWLAAYAGGGIAAGLVVFGVQSFVYGRTLTRDPKEQARNAARGAAVGLPLAAAGFVALAALGPPVELAVSAAGVGFLPVLAAWRWHFDRSGAAG